MNTTTADRIDDLDEPERTSRQAAQPVLGAAQQVWYVGLGMVAFAGEQAWRFLNVLSKKGQQVQPSLKHGMTTAVGGVSTGFKKASGKISRRAEDLGEDFEDRVGDTVQRMGLATRDQITSLEERIADLQTRLEQRRETGGNGEKKKQDKR